MLAGGNPLQANTASFNSISLKGTFGKRSMSMAHPMVNPQTLDFDKSPGQTSNAHIPNFTLIDDPSRQVLE